MSATEITIKYLGVPLVVSGNYQPAEPAEEFYPGCFEDFEVEEVATVHGDIITAIFEDNDQIRDLALEAIGDQQAGEEAENEGGGRE
jgi:hypothetical protein